MSVHRVCQHCLMHSKRPLKAKCGVEHLGIHRKIEMFLSCLTFWLNAFVRVALIYKPSDMIAE